MKSINQVTLMGNLVRDPELRSTPSGSNVLSFTLALNKSYKDKAGQWQQMTDYIDITAWSVLADRLQGILAKGNLVVVTGSLKTNTWEKDGQKHSKVNVTASDVISLEKKESNTAVSIDGAHFPKGSSVDIRQKDTLPDSDEPMDLSDIPF